MDVLMLLSAQYFSSSGCAACGADLAACGAAPRTCPGCEVATYCSDACAAASRTGEHAAHCGLLADLHEVLNVDMDRYIQPVPFR